MSDRQWTVAPVPSREWRRRVDRHRARQSPAYRILSSRRSEALNVRPAAPPWGGPWFGDFSSWHMPTVDEVVSACRGSSQHEVGSAHDESVNKAAGFVNKCP